MFHKYHIYRYLFIICGTSGMCGIMAKFIVKLKDDIKRRIVIDKDAWESENLKKGDYAEIDIKKIKKSD